MKKYMYNYIEYVEANKKKVNSEEMLVKIEFFQHERLIHLIITLFYVLMFLVFLVLISISYIFIIPSALLMVFVIFYIIHYFVLENGIQYLYKLYDTVNSQKRKTTTQKRKQ